MSTPLKAQALFDRLNNTQLCKTWLETNTMLTKTLSQEDRRAIGISRDWFLEEFDRRFGEDLVNQWLDAEFETGEWLDPADFLIQKDDAGLGRSSTKTARRRVRASAASADQ